MTVRVRLNGVEVATLWSLPFTVRLPSLSPKGNVLEIDVTKSSHRVSMARSCWFR